MESALYQISSSGVRRLNNKYNARIYIQKATAIQAQEAINSLVEALTRTRNVIGIIKYTRQDTRAQYNQKRSPMTEDCKMATEEVRQQAEIDKLIGSNEVCIDMLEIIKVYVVSLVPDLVDEWTNA